MIKNFFKFYDTYAPEEQKAASIIFEEFKQKHSQNPELDVSHVSEQDILNLLLLEEFMGQEGRTFSKLLQTLTSPQRVKRNQELQDSCKETLYKIGMPYRREWIDRYGQDMRSLEQREFEELGYALVLLERDGVESFAVRIAKNLDFGIRKFKGKAEKTK